MRSIAVAVAVLSMSAAAWTASGNGPRQAGACGVVAVTIEDILRDASFVGVVETTSVGDAVNRHPPLLLSSPTAVVTEPTGATATATRRSLIRTPTLPPSPTVTPTMSLNHALAGLGAEATVLRQIAGPSRDAISIDAQTRANYERFLREQEAGLLAPCGHLFAGPTYEPAVRYLVVLTGEHLSTILRFPMAGNDVLLPRDLPYANLYFDEPTYYRYLPGAEAEFSQERDMNGNRRVFITAERIPVERLVALIVGLRSGITPPEAGNAGIK